MTSSGRFAALSIVMAIGPVVRAQARPATVVLDRGGIVRWFLVSRNVQVRPDPGDVSGDVRAH